MNLRTLSFGVLFVVGMSAASPAAAAESSSVADFYRNKIIRIIVGYTPGGGFDTYSRLVARHMSRYLPGNPKFIVQNKPGAGGLVAARSVFTVEPKDGTVLVNTNQGLVLQSAIGRKGIDIDMGKFNWLGAANKPRGGCFVRKDLGIDSIEDVTRREITTGTSTPGSMGYDIPAVLNAALGTRFKMITGYRGISPVQAALLRKEVDAFCSADPLAGVLAATLGGEDAVAKVIVIMGEEPSAAPLLKGVPAAGALAKTAEQKEMLRAINAPLSMAFPWAVAPEVPAERVKVLRDAMEKTFKDAKFLAEAKRAKMGVHFSNGQEVTRIVDNMINAPAETLAKLRAVLGK